MPKSNNKHVIRKELEKGKFTTVHHSILFNTNITPIAFRVFTIVLSDSDTNFNVSQTALAKRLKVHKETIKGALENLEEFGYLRRVIPKYSKRGHYYIIDEAGRLNNKNFFNSILNKLGYPSIEKDEEVLEKTEIIPTIEVENLSQNITKNKELLEKYTVSIVDILSFNESNVDYLLKLEQENTDANGLVDYYKIKSMYDKEIVTPILKECHKFGMEPLLTIGKNYPNKVKNAYSVWLKEQIFTNINLNINGEKELRRFNRELNKPKLDYETLKRDKAEEEYYDNLSMN